MIDLRSFVICGQRLFRILLHTVACDTLEYFHFNIIFELIDSFASGAIQLRSGKYRVSAFDRTAHTHTLNTDVTLYRVGSSANRHQSCSNSSNLPNAHERSNSLVCFAVATFPIISGAVTKFKRIDPLFHLFCHIFDYLRLSRTNLC